MGERVQVLIVDDEKNVRLMLKQALSEEPYVIRTAVNGEDALDKLAEKPANVVLLDMKLPGMEGMQVLRQIRSHYPGTQVIMITAYGSIETAVEALKLGAIDFLRKPFATNQIRALVHEVLDRQRLDVNELSGFADLLQYAKYCMNNFDLNEALDFLHKAVALDPTKPEPFNLMGVTYELWGKFQQAQKMYRAALALDSAYMPADANLTRISGFNYSKKDMDLGEDKKLNK